MNKIAGYTEVLLPDGNKVSLKFGMWTFRELCKKWDVSMQEIQEAVKDRMAKDPFTALFDVIAPAAVYASTMKGEPITVSEMQISSWIDDTGGLGKSPVIRQVMNAFANALGVDMTESLAAEGAGKSVTTAAE